MTDAMTIDQIEALLDRKLAALTPKKGRDDRSGGNKEAGGVIAWWIESYGYSIQYVANKAGIHRSFLSRIIDGDRGMSIETLAKLTRVFPHADFPNEVLAAYRNPGGHANGLAAGFPGQQPVEGEPLAEA